jgi:hypothetical protein
MGTSFAPVAETGTFRIEIPEFLVRAGAYTVNIQASHGTTAPEDFYDKVEGAASLRVHPGDYWRSGCANRPGSFALIPGVIRNGVHA